jgi:hypothetical protein
MSLMFIIELIYHAVFEKLCANMAPNPLIEFSSFIKLFIQVDMNMRINLFFVETTEFIIEMTVVFI